MSRPTRTGGDASALLCLALALGACTPPTDGDGGAALGESGYRTHCASCHQLDGKGLAAVFPPLAGSDWLHSRPPEDAITAVLKGISGELVVNGVRYNGVMPGLGHLSDVEVASILSYVYASWGNSGTEVDAAQVAARRREEPPAQSEAPLGVPRDEVPAAPAAEDGTHGAR